VVSYHDYGNKDLAVRRCNDADCTSVGGANPNTGGDVGEFTSLALNSSGYPVVSYFDRTNWDLKVLRCGNADCTSLGNSIQSPDTTGLVGLYTSLALDSSGHPVVSYYDNGINGNLKVMNCNDLDCAGLDESITSPDQGGDVGSYTSLALDGDGYPVVSYYNWTSKDLKVMHCNDVNCAGLNETINTPDTGGIGNHDVGMFTSLVLDGSRHPVISYYDNTSGDLKVMHCNDVNCAGDNESITTPHVGDVSRQPTSLVLDGSGKPVISYTEYGGWPIPAHRLTVMHCNDVDCAGLDESITSPDTEGIVGEMNSLALDSSGYPVVSYYDRTNGDLKVMHCNDLNCAGGNETITSPDTTGIVGGHTSLALDGNGYPVVSYYDASHRALKLLHCGSANCTTGDAGGVGGIQALPDVAESAGSGSSSSLLYAAIAGAAAAAVLAITAGGWYARRRWRAG